MAERDVVNRTLSKLEHLNRTNDVVRQSEVIKAFGGYSDIFVGIYKPTGRRVAIKRLRVHMRLDLQFTKSFAREITIWAKLDHPNIIVLVGFIMEDDFPSLISEWADNGTVVSYLKKYPQTDVVKIALGIARGLKYIHDHDVIHSDLKGDNILMSGTGEPSISDFGLSRMMSYSQTLLATTCHGSTKGSARWMAPELLDPKEDDVKHTKASDIWAYGMTVYEIMSLQLPYAHLKTDLKVMMAIVNGEAPSQPDDLPDQSVLWYLLKQCCVWDPNCRITAGDVPHKLASGFDMAWNLCNSPTIELPPATPSYRPSAIPAHLRLDFESWEEDDRHLFDVRDQLGDLLKAMNSTGGSNTNKDHKLLEVRKSQLSPAAEN